MYRLTRVLALLALVAGVALSCACSASSEQAGLDRLYGLDEPVRIGAYEIVMTRARFITDPDEESGLAWRPGIAPGMAQLDIAIAVHNPADEGGATLPQLRTDGAFRLLGDDGSTIESHGVGFSPPPAGVADTVSRQSAGVGDALSREIAPGGSMSIYPMYLTSTDGGSLTLEYAPFVDDPDTVVMFEVR